MCSHPHVDPVNMFICLFFIYVSMMAMTMMINPFGVGVIKERASCDGVRHNMMTFLQVRVEKSK